MIERLVAFFTAKRLLRVAVVVATVALASCLAYALGTLPFRPLDGVEGEVLFEAQRLRRSLPLYTDPGIGAFDDGPVPARFYVLYPPLWAWVLSLVPQKSAGVVGRAVACAAWFGFPFLVGLLAPIERRRCALAAGAFTAGIFTLALFGSAMRPDAVAVTLAGAGLLRAVHTRRLDAKCGVLFALAAWTKPNVIGIASGAMATGAFLDRRSTARAIAAAVATSVVVAAILQRLSGGAWLDHLLRATGQPMSLSLWIDQLSSRLPFFGAPLAVVLYSGWRARLDDGVRMALGALALSLAWTLLCLAKIGSATNYWMEPAAAAVVLVSRAAIVVPPGRAASRAFMAAAVVQSLWVGVATVRSSAEGLVAARAHAAFLARVRQRCGAREGDIILADEPGLEWMLDGRIITTPFQMTHLARRGKYPLGPWLGDIWRPEVRCLVMQDDLLDRPPRDVSIEHDRFGPELRSALRSRFAPVIDGDGQAEWRLYRARDERR